MLFPLEPIKRCSLTRVAIFSCRWDNVFFLLLRSSFKACFITLRLFWFFKFPILFYEGFCILNNISLSYLYWRMLKKKTATPITFLTPLTLRIGRKNGGLSPSVLNLTSPYRYVIVIPKSMSYYFHHTDMWDSRCKCNRLAALDALNSCIQYECGLVA